MIGCLNMRLLHKTLLPHNHHPVVKFLVLMVTAPTSSSLRAASER